MDGKVGQFLDFIVSKSHLTISHFAIRCPSIDIPSLIPSPPLPFILFCGYRSTLGPPLYLSSIRKSAAISK